MNRLNKKLVKIVATLLCQDEATHPAFFWELAEEMRGRGWELQFHQRGIHGTYVQLVRSGELRDVEIRSSDKGSKQERANEGGA